MYVSDRWWYEHEVCLFVCFIPTPPDPYRIRFQPLGHVGVGVYLTLWCTEVLYLGSIRLAVPQPAISRKSRKIYLLVHGNKNKNESRKRPRDILACPGASRDEHEVGSLETEISDTKEKSQAGEYSENAKARLLNRARERADAPIKPHGGRNAG